MHKVLGTKATDFGSVCCFVLPSTSKTKVTFHILVFSIKQLFTLRFLVSSSCHLNPPRNSNTMQINKTTYKSQESRIVCNFININPLIQTTIF